jgi:diguanylate cyclase (GGDEF)-like protein
MSVGTAGLSERCDRGELGLAFLSEPNLLFTPDREFRQQMTVAIGLIAPAIVVFLRTRLAGALERERALRERAEAANHELRTLRAELVRYARQLERLATTDDLTGLCNRRHFLAVAEDARSRHGREQRPLSLLIFDIDLFKSVNDRFGHDAGDSVIRHVADVCRNSAGTSDILARLGGEEFILLLPGATGEEAMARADDMRRRLEATPFEIDGSKVRVTVSIGVAEAAPSRLHRRPDEARGPSALSGQARRPQLRALRSQGIEAGQCPSCRCSRCLIRFPFATKRDTSRRWSPASASTDCLSSAACSRAAPRHRPPLRRVW